MIKTCVIVGASHAGVNCAFALRNYGWSGKIILLDAAPHLPYAKPPLSKTFLTDQCEPAEIKNKSAYAQQDIDLRLGSRVLEIDSDNHTVFLEDASLILFDFLVLAPGAKAVIPPIEGVHSSHVYYLRTLSDALKIKKATINNEKDKFLIIGAGYVGLEIAASLRKLQKSVVIVEREERILSRVTSEITSSYFYDLHTKNGVKIFCDKEVIRISKNAKQSSVLCADGTVFHADSIIVGVGAIPQTHLAEQAGLDIDKGILIDQNCRTSNPKIFAIGDCTRFKHPLYKDFIRIESIQNAVDQAKIAANNIAGNVVDYDSLPWFWSDQYEVKLQMAGLPVDYDNLIMRKKSDEEVSIWYLKNDQIIAVDAINNPRAYMLGMKLIKSKSQVEPKKIKDIETPLSATSFLKEV